MERNKIMPKTDTSASETGIRVHAIYQRSSFRKVLLLISLCLVLIAVCAFRTASKPIVVTIADNEKTVTVPAGSTVIIQLPSNAGSTGYTWNFVTSKNLALTWQSAHYVAPAGHPLLGAPGTVLFTFLAHNSGKVQLQFELRRAWEVGVPPVQRFSVTLQVDSPGSPS